jgi:hypothetical protein
MKCIDSPKLANRIPRQQHSLNPTIPTRRAFVPQWLSAFVPLSLTQPLLPPPESGNAR